ncbi:MAG: methyltransferase domain-containing protein [Candidatus Gracilibacteria bacterium]|nr:methyltransferase domain-containing protein [Candidatus Gracilibacteria bacterium]
MVYASLLIYVIIIGLVTYFFMSSFISIFLGSGVPYVPTYDDDILVLKDNLEINENKKLLDLGCGDGKVLRFFEKNFKMSILDGYDINSYAINYGKLLLWLGKFKKIHLYRKNFLDAPIKEYDYIYTYLLTHLMEKIEDHVFSNMKDNAIIISNSFKFKNHEPFKIICNKKGKERIFLYKKD